MKRKEMEEVDSITERRQIFNKTQPKTEEEKS